MAGVNLLKRLSEREVEEGVVGEGAHDGSALGGGIKDALVNAIADLTAHQKTNLILFSVSLVLMFFQSDVVNIVYFEQLLEEKQSVNQQLKIQVSKLTNESKAFGELTGQIADYNRKLTDLRHKIEEIEAIRKSKRDFAIRLTDYVVSELPEGVWLSGVRVDVKNTRKVELDGKSLDLTLIGTYMQRLEKGAFFPKWTLVSNAADKLADGDRDIRQFSIDAGIVEVQ